jgi:serine O-acetyltransferase
MSLISRLIYLRSNRFLRLPAKELLAIYGVEVPSGVKVGRNLKIMHRGFGTVIHPGTIIGDDVTIYHGVTVGRADPWIPGSQSTMSNIYIDNCAVLCAGAKVICKTGTLRVAEGSIIGANSVLTQSTGPGEIWAGAPARLVGKR